MSYKSTHTGAQIDAGVSAALNPDATPTLSSTNLVTSGGVAAKLSEKQDTLVFDNAPTSGSNNPVKSGGIYTALAGKASNADLALKANMASLAPAFDSTATYVVGDLVLYDGAVYRFTAAHTGAWDAGDVEQTTLGAELVGVKSASNDADSALMLGLFNSHDVVTLNSFNLVNKGIAINGKYDNGNLKRVSTIYLIPAKKGTRISVTLGTNTKRWFLHEYDEGMNRVAGTSAWITQDNQAWTTQRDGYIAITFAKASNDSSEFPISQYDAVTKITPPYTVNSKLIDYSHADFNYYEEPGCYSIGSGIMMSNAPMTISSKPVYFMVIQYDNNSIKQIAFYANPEAIYTRTKIGGVWQSWGSINEVSLNRGHIFDLFTPSFSKRYIFGKGSRWKYLLNTIESFTDAGENPLCWGITGDVQYTSDGYIVMFHDATVEYEGQQAYINDLTYAQIQTIVLTDGTRNYTIPTVDDFLGICRKYGKVPLLESKARTVGASWIESGHQTELETVIKKVINLGMLDRVFWIGYGQDLIYLDSNYHHKFGLVYTYDGHIQDWETTRRSMYGNPYYIHAGYPETETWTNGFDAEVMGEIHAVGSYAIGYTPPENASNYIQTMIDLNYDAIILYAAPPEDS